MKNDKEIKIIHDTRWPDNLHSPWGTSSDTNEGTPFTRTVTGTNITYDMATGEVTTTHLMRLQCPSCPGECYFDIEGPDYDVGLTGYTAIYNEALSDHEPNCMFNRNADLIANTEDKVAQELVSNVYNLVDEL